MAPLPFCWKVCFSVVASRICLTASPLGEALALELALVLAELELEVELELELELEHPAVAAQAAPGLILPGGDLIANADFRAR